MAGRVQKRAYVTCDSVDVELDIPPSADVMLMREFTRLERSGRRRTRILREGRIIDSGYESLYSVQYLLHLLHGYDM